MLLLELRVDVHNMKCRKPGASHVMAGPNACSSPWHAGVGMGMDVLSLLATGLSQHRGELIMHTADFLILLRGRK